MLFVVARRPTPGLLTFGVILGVQWEMSMGIPIRGYLGMLALVPFSLPKVRGCLDA
jgi:hypothetical protein